MADHRQLQTSGIFNGIAVLLAATVLVSLFAGAVAAEPDGNNPEFWDTEGLNQSYIQQSQVQSHTYNFTINATNTNTVAPDFLKITLSFNGTNLTWSNKGGTDYVHQWSSSDPDLYTFEPGGSWSQVPESGQTIYFNMSGETDGGSSDGTGPRWLEMYVDGDKPYLTNRTPAPGGRIAKPQPLVSMIVNDTDGKVDWSSVNVTLKNSTHKFLNSSGISQSSAITQNGHNITVNASKGGFSYNTSDKVKVKVSVNDTVDHQTVSEWSFAYDNKAPRDVVLEHPDVNIAKMMDEKLDVSYAYNETNPYRVNITLNDNSGNSATWVVSDEDESGPIVTATHSLDLDNATSGSISHGSTYNISLKIIDRAGNINDSQDIGDQVVSISNIQFGSDYYRRGDSARFTVYDQSQNTESGYRNWINSTQGSEIKVNSSKASDVTHLDLHETGKNSSRFETTFTVGGSFNVSDADTLRGWYPYLSGIAEATVDEVPPASIKILQPNGTVYASSKDGDTTFGLHFNYTEEGSGADLIDLQVGGLEFNNTNPSSRTGEVKTWIYGDLNNTGISEGEYSLNLSVTDKVGLTGYTDSKKLVVDNTPPEGNVTDIENAVESGGSYYIGSTGKRNVTLKVDEKNPLPNSSVYLRYSIGGTNRSEMINSSDFGQDNRTKIVIDDSGLSGGGTVKLWINGTDRAGNNWTSSFREPLETYVYDNTKPHRSAVKFNNRSCNVEFTTIDSSDDLSRISHFRIWRDGKLVEDSVNATANGNMKAGSFEDAVKNGTYTYQITAVDAVGLKRNTTVTARSKLGEIEMDVSTDFADVFEEGGTLYSNRSMQIRVTDSCTSLNHGKGNIIRGEQVDLETSGKNGWINLTNSKSTTDSEGFARANLTSKLGGTSINISTDVGVKTLNGWRNRSRILNIQLEEKRYDLEKGWNFVSIPIYLGDKTVDEVVGGVNGTNVEAIWGYDTANETWNVYNPEKADNDLQNLKFGKGYWVNTTGEGELTIHGTLAEVQNPDNIQDLAPDEVTLHEGWNMVGFGRWMNASKYLSEFNIGQYYKYSSIDAQTGIYKEADNATTGQGYWVYMDNKTTAAAASLR